MKFHFTLKFHIAQDSLEGPRVRGGSGGYPGGAPQGLTVCPDMCKDARSAKSSATNEGVEVRKACGTAMRHGARRKADNHGRTERGGRSARTFRCGDRLLDLDERRGQELRKKPDL